MNGPAKPRPRRFNVLASIGVLAATWTVYAQPVCDPVRHGARHDGVADDTAAIQAAIDECAHKGGGVVRLTSGVFVAAPLVLRNRITLDVEAGATLLAIADRNRYADANETHGVRALINAYGAEDIAISGSGVIDGNGAPWWDAFRVDKREGKPERGRPRLIQFTDCRRVRVSDITLRNSPSFHLAPRRCDDVQIRGVKIFAPADSPNTDGIDPAGSIHVRISECLIDVGDDNIALKSGAPAASRRFAAEDMTVEDCTFLHGHGMSIGSETNGGVHGVRVRRCTFRNTRNGLRIKSYRGHGGEVADVSYSDITMENVETPILFTAYYPKIPASDTPQPVTADTPFYHDIRVENLTATGARSAGVIVGLPEKPLSGISLAHVTISAGTGLTVRNASVQISGVQIKTSRGEPFLVEHGELQRR